MPTSSGYSLLGRCQANSRDLVSFSVSLWGFIPVLAVAGGFDQLVRQVCRLDLADRDASEIERAARELEKLLDANERRAVERITAGRFERQNKPLSGGHF